MLDTLLEEVAHCIDIARHGWKNGHSRQHGRGWSDAYGMLKREFWEVFGDDTA